VTVRLGRAAAARHFGIAFIRHIRSTRLLSAIAILGLTIGLTGAILMALVARTALNFNTFLPDHERTYLATSVLSGPGMAPDYNQASNGRAAELLIANVPDVEAVARLAEEEVVIGRAGRQARRNIYWADPAAFDVLKLPALHGDPAAALARPDGIVLTRAESIRLFGRENALGERLDIAGQPMIVAAILADLPANATDLTHGIFASGLAAGSALARQADAPGSFSIGVRTYLRLRQGAPPEQVEQRIAPFINGLLPPPMRGAYAMRLARIDRLALHEGFHPAARERLALGIVVASLILLVAIANFINVGVSLALRRRREIGVRKAHGASAIQIGAQLLGESIATVLIAALMAAAAAELLLPFMNRFLEVQASFDYATDPSLIGWLLLAALLIGLAAGAFPAMLMARLSPVAVIRNLPLQGGRGFVRSMLISGQFAILIGLIVATAVVYQQRLYAMNDAVRADIDQVVTIAAPCPESFRQEVARLRGVAGVSCSGHELLSGEIFAFVDIGGRRVSADIVSALPATFGLYGIRPVAGSLAGLPAEGETAISRIVINEAAARDFGFGSPSAAIGRIVPVPAAEPGPNRRAEVVAVVPDFSFSSVETAIEPTIYLDQPSYPLGEGMVSIKLVGNQIPETLAAIARIWRATGQEGEIQPVFVDDHVEALYRDLARNTQVLAFFAGLAAFLACLGLVGLSSAALERKTKEIGIRKALGARTGQVLALLLRQQSRPVLWANLIAWPVAWLVLENWLDGFAYHVPLQLWLFPAAGFIALAVAVASIGSQCYLVARAMPIHALRHE
jgi:putative ABC transport system permease protein